MFFRRTRFTRELNEEIDAHLREREAAYVRDGMTPADARRRARLDFGNPSVIHEQSRDVWLVRWIENTRRDTRIALRMLRSAPGFAAAAIATLALGIGANTAIFTMVDALLVRPLPYAEPEQLVQIAPGFPRGATAVFREHGRHFAGIGGYRGGTEVTWTGGPEPMRLDATLVTGDLFPLLGAVPEYGRAIELRDERHGADRVVVVSHGFWRQHLGGTTDAIGRTISINDEPLRVVGVMPTSFRFPTSTTTDLWIPVTIDPPDPITLWASFGMRYVARLERGVSLDVARQDLPRLCALIRDGFPWPMPTSFGEGTTLVPLQQSATADVREGFLLLSGAVALVLMIACANVATLLLARSEGRAREIAVRSALGAGRHRLALQLFIESGLVASLGAAAGVGALVALLPAMSAAMPPDVPRIRDLTVDVRVVAFAAAAAILTTLFIGLLPALRASRGDLTASLKGGDARSGRRTRAFSTLVATEVALALVLVAGAGLLMRSLSNLTTVHPGFEVSGLVSARLHPIEGRYQTPAARVGLYRDVLERVSAVPGVRAAAAASSVPLDGQWNALALAIEDHPVATGAPAWVADQRFVTPGYFSVMRIRLREGRAFEEQDGATAPRVVIVNESMARRYWPGKSPVGRRIKPVWQTDWRTIVGVTADVQNRELGTAPEDEIYIPYAQNPVGGMVVIARTDADEAHTASAVRHAASEIDRQAPVTDAAPVSAMLRDAVADRRFILQVLGAFAIVALALGAIGIYGVTAYGVARRAREIGLRLALGATRRGVIVQLLGQTGRPIAAGIVLGLAGAVGSAQLLRGMLYRSSPTDPMILGSVIALLAATAVTATIIPAIRATRVDPASALRQE